MKKFKDIRRPLDYGTPESVRLMRQKTPGENVSELSMKRDKKLPNLKLPVKGPKGVSKYMRRKMSNEPYTSANKKSLQSSTERYNK